MHGTKTTRLSLLLLASCCILAAVLAQLACAHTIERVSVASDGTPANWGSWCSSLSADGRFVAFYSVADNLIPGDINGSYGDIYVHDRSTGITERVSVSSDGAQGNGESGGDGPPSISADGRFVAFSSDATNLVPGDTNSFGDIFVHDRETGQTELVSVAPDGGQANGRSAGPSLSADGRFVVFGSTASNLVPDDVNGQWDVFVYDRSTGQTELVSVASDGRHANYSSGAPSISADGRFVTFSSPSTNLVPGVNECWNVFIHDRATSVTECVSVTPEGIPGNANCYGERSPVSADGRFVAFESGASDLIPGVATGWNHIFVRDRVAGTTELISIAPDGSQGNWDSRYTAMSADGRFVAFLSDASNLVPGDTVPVDAFVRDRVAGITKRVSLTADGAQGDGSDGVGGVSISVDGRFVGFGSRDPKLVPGAVSYWHYVYVASNDTLGRLKGQVRVRGTTTDIEGATVEAYCAGELENQVATGAYGIYETDTMPVGLYTVVAHKQGYTRQTKGATVSADQTTYVNFGLEVSGRITGQVREKGTTTNIEGATVTAYLGGTAQVTATTGANGIYVIDTDLPAGSYTLSAAKAGYLTQTKTSLAVTGGATIYVNFNLELPPAIKGQVRQAGSSVNLAGATVRVYWGEMATASAVTDAQGIYAIHAGLAPGVYRVDASAPGYVRQTKTNIATADGQTAFVNFNLAVSGKLKGQVTDRVSGANLIDATVLARSGGIVRATTWTSLPWGVYEIDADLPPGTYVLQASRTGYLAQVKMDIVVTAASTTYVNFTLQPR